jgi:proprotein convertase subtilisin/kexin type 5
MIQGDEPYIRTNNAETGTPMIKIELKGLKNPYTSAQTDSFQMQTFNVLVSESGKEFWFYIDKVEYGLFINSDCNYPCKSCPLKKNGYEEDQPDVCLSCYDDLNLSTGLPYRQENSCVAECATSRFYNTVDKHCDLCNDTCLDCTESADNCIVCGVGIWKYLHIAECLDVCPAGFIEKPSENKCIDCHPTCMTCENTYTTCTSCDPDGDTPFFFRNQCTDSCPKGTSVEIDGACIECDSTCLTCEGTPQTCTSCESHMKFDAEKNTCEQLCEPERQIFIPPRNGTDEAGTCQNCNPNCDKCAGTVDTCTTCKEGEGLVLNTDQTCDKTCNSDS